MPVEHDPVSQIVNVAWDEEGGAVFVAGGYAEFVLYIKIENKEEVTDNKVTVTDLEDLGVFTLVSGEGTYPAAEVAASSYKKIETHTDTDTGTNVKATFILGGNDAVISDSPSGPQPGAGSVVMVSHDGQNWTKAFRKQWPDRSANVSKVLNFAWDRDKFYGDVFSTEFYSGVGLTESKIFERLLTSSDGENWSESTNSFRYDSAGGGPSSTEPPVLFMPHINDKAHLPDGKFGYYEVKNNEDTITESLLVVPTKVSPLWYMDEFVPYDYGNSVDITILKDGETTKRTSVTPIKYVTCAAYASEILLAGGTKSDTTPRAQIAASVDNGETWRIIWEATHSWYQRINTITAAPASDLEEATA